MAAESCPHGIIPAAACPACTADSLLSPRSRPAQPDLEVVAHPKGSQRSTVIGVGWTNAETGEINVRLGPYVVLHGNDLDLRIVIRKPQSP